MKGHRHTSRQRRMLQSARQACQASRCPHSPPPAPPPPPHHHWRNAAITALASLEPASAALADDAPTAAAATPSNGVLAPIVDSLDFILTHIQAVYVDLGVPYSYGWSIVTLTAFVKLLTLPFTKKQVESAMAVQSLKPRLDVIKARYGENKEKISKETQRLYTQAGVNPLAGCLPSLATIPIFIGLYRSLSDVAKSGALDAEGFYWVPSLAGPIDGSGVGGVSWLLPLVDGAPPIGWPAASAYLVFPVLLVVTQYVSTSLITPPSDPHDKKPLTQTLLINGLPLMIGWFALNVPAGLSLYYFCNSVFATAQQVYFRKLGGVVIDTPDLGPVKQLGMGRRMGERFVAPALASSRAALAAGAARDGEASDLQMAAEQEEAPTQAGPDSSDGVPAAPSNGAVRNGAGHAAARAPVLVKRKKLQPAQVA